MRAADIEYFEKYAIDPVGEEFVLDAFVDGWAEDLDGEVPESNEYYEEQWEDFE